MSMPGAPSPGGSPFGERKSFKNFEKKLSAKNLLSNQESNQSKDDDFRAIARRISRSSGGSQLLLDPAARLAAQKKLEAEEKLKLQKEIEDLKSKMNSVETVEKTGFKYDPSKVRGQIESEMKETEELVEAAPENEESEEYREWLEEIMSQGWSEEVKELVQGRKKVSKRNLIRARKRSIVRRYTLIIPEVVDDYNIPPEEDEFTEQEKLRQAIEKEFDGINLEYTIESLSNNKEWSAEIQELVVAKKKINHHNLGNARKRNIVKRIQESYPGCTYELQLEPDEYTEIELLRRNIDSQIAEIKIIIDSDQDLDAIVTSIQKKWRFNINQLDIDKKKRNRRNIFNYLVRQIISEGKEKEPDLNYQIDLEEDEYTDEEIKRREYEQGAREIDDAYLGQSLNDIQKKCFHVAEKLDSLSYKISKDNLIRMMKLDLCKEVFGNNENVIAFYMLNDEHFELSHKALANQFINSALAQFEEELGQTDKIFYNKAFPSQAETLRFSKSKLNSDNLRMCYTYEVETEALKRYPDCGIEPSIPKYELSDDGVSYYSLKEELNKLNELSQNLVPEDVFGKFEWETEEQYILDNNLKPTINNIINARKRILCYAFQKQYYKSDLADDIEFEEYSAEELFQQKQERKEKEHRKLKRELSQELEEVYAVLEIASRRAEKESKGIEDFLSDEWQEEINSLVMAGLPVNRKNLYDVKAIHVLEKYKRENSDFVFDDIIFRKNPFESDLDDEPSTENDSEMGCLSCEMRSRSSFFEESTEASSQNLDRIEEDAFTSNEDDSVSIGDVDIDGRAKEAKGTTESNKATTADNIIQDSVLDNSEAANEIAQLPIDDSCHAVESVHLVSETKETSDTVYPGKDSSEEIEPTEQEVQKVYQEVELDIDQAAELIDKKAIGNVDNHKVATMRDEDKQSSTTRPTILLSEGFTPNPGSSISDLDSSKLPTSVMETPRDPIASPFPTHGYVSPSKTFNSLVGGSESFQPSVESPVDTDSIEDSAYESRQSAKSEDESQMGEASVRFPRTDNLPESHATINSLLDNADQLLPFTLHCDSIGSDNVFDGAGTSSSRQSDVLTPSSNRHESADKVVQPVVEIEEPISGNEGDVELSPSDDCINEGNPSPCNLPEKTTEILKNMSESSEDEEDGKQQNVQRTTKRKKFSCPSDTHPTIKRQEEYIKRTSILEAKRLELSKSKETLENSGKDKTATKTHPDVSPDKYSHIQSSYKVQKSSPYFDRSKYVKVPTLEDKIVRSKPLMEGLIPKDFYDQKLSFDVRSAAAEADLIDSSPGFKPRQRSVSEVVLSSAPTTGHMLWNMMKERRLEREKVDDLTDLDLAVRAIVSRCTCKTPFQLDRVGDGKYKLPHTSQIFFVRILRNHVMVRVGGGWDTLDHFIAKHDPCRMKFKQIIGGENYSPKQQQQSAEATNSPRTPNRKLLQSPHVKDKRIQKSASGSSIRSISPSKSVKKSPISTPKASRVKKPEGSKIPGPRSNSKLPQPKSRA